MKTPCGVPSPPPAQETWACLPRAGGKGSKILSKSVQRCKCLWFVAIWPKMVPRELQKVQKVKKPHLHLEHILDQSGSKRASKKVVQKACPNIAPPGSQKAPPKDLKIDPRAPKTLPRDVPGPFPKRVPQKVTLFVVFEGARDLEK